ncbi:hypothetical protein H696_03027 [Fonticula alba]|uniref:Beta-catenin-like protein 1 N-terminal domain-containing protein n=1 Tax=Fonticula alba TaxID=691883 RepID=A0A058ZB69_FONAL|nr:hypothetical protein H696_03027 [Fonticula alba]KCV70672.1 hypothetical protein H696_03027 [Fonticula alba]|eukprot:XP_009495188.1 hypothetical protein H696_03027 [Fonticula alba]
MDIDSLFKDLKSAPTRQPRDNAPAPGKRSAPPAELLEFSGGGADVPATVFGTGAGSSKRARTGLSLPPPTAQVTSTASLDDDDDRGVEFSRDDFQFVSFGEDDEGEDAATGLGLDEEDPYLAARERRGPAIPPSGAPIASQVTSMTKMIFDQLPDLPDTAPEAEGLGFLKGELKRLTVALEKALEANQTARGRFPDDPSKFMESEIELNACLKSMEIFPAEPALFAEIAAGPVPKILTDLLVHDNVDLSVTVVDLLKEFCDSDNILEAEAETRRLVRSLLDRQLLSLLMANLKRLNEKAEAESQCLFDTMSIFENLIELDPTTADTLAGEEVPLAKWLLQRVARTGGEPFNTNTQYASELLSIILQLSERARLGLSPSDRAPETELTFALLDGCGLDLLLQALAGCAYLRKTYKDDYDEMAEEEHVLSIIVSLLRFASTKPQPNRQRVLAKFSEDNFMKIDRLVDLLVVYTEREKRNAEALAQIRLSHLSRNESVDEDSLFSRRLEQGAFQLHLVSIIIAWVVILGGKLAERVRATLALRDFTPDVILAHLEDALWPSPSTQPA